MDKLTIKEIVDKACKEKGINKAELARLTGRERSTLSNLLKNGNPHLMKFKDILHHVEYTLIAKSSKGEEFVL